MYTIADTLNIPVRLVELRFNNLDEDELKELEDMEDIFAI